MLGEAGKPEMVIQKPILFQFLYAHQNQR